MNNQELQIKYIKMESVDKNDYPEFCEARIVSARHKNGIVLTEKELIDLNKDATFVNDMAHEYVRDELEYQADILRG